MSRWRVTIRPVRILAPWALAAVALALVPACHHNAAKDPDTFIGRAQIAPRHTAKPIAETRPLPGLKSSLIVDLPEKSVGPFLARNSGTAMGVYWGPGENGAHRLVSLPMGFDGAPKEPRVIATTMAESTMLVMRAAGGEPHGPTPFIAGWTELTDRGEALSVVGIGGDGAPSMPPVELERSTDDIVWVELVPTPRGELCVWAEETRASNANILAVALDPNGKPRGVPSRVARNVTAWQIVSTPAGAGLALVSPEPAPTLVSPVPSPPTPASDTRRPKGSSISWLTLDGEARTIGPATPVATSPTKVIDIDVATVRDSFVLAWTDRSQPDPDVWLAAIGAEGKVKPAHAVTARSGGARLAAIGGAKSGGILIWEEARKRPRQSRSLHLAKIDPEGALGAVSSVVEVDPLGTPEIATLGDGFALLTRARWCPDPLGSGDTPCPASVPAPTFVRFDMTLRAVQTEPIRLDEGPDVASLAWGLSCEAEQCLVFAVGQESPARIRAIELTEMPNRWRAPVPPKLGAAAPTVVGVDTVQGGDLFAEVAVALTSEGSLVAAVTAGGDDPGHGAAVTVRPLDTGGVARGPSTILTKRALSVGGVSIAAAPKSDGAVVAWIGREGQNAQVHLTRVDRLGRRTKEVLLTSSPGNTNDVAIAWSGGGRGGWTVAWVDTRDGNGEVYATRVDIDLNRIAREERITNAPGDASDVALLAPPSDATDKSGGGDVWLAWADPRENPHDGFADIFVAKLSAVSAKAVVPESRVLATAAHSRSPSLAWGGIGGRPAIAWIEEAPMSAGSDNSGAYGAMIGSLDDGGRLVGDPIRTRGAGDGYPTSVAIEPGGASLHVVLARAARDDLSLDAVEIVAGQEPSPSLLFVLDGPPSLDVSLSLLGGAVFFNDEGVEVGDGRTRRLGVGWTR
jgi:hypothetical protein